MANDPESQSKLCITHKKQNKNQLAIKNNDVVSLNLMLISSKHVSSSPVSSSLGTNDLGTMLAFHKDLSRDHYNATTVD